MIELGCSIHMQALMSWSWCTLGGLSFDEDQCGRRCRREGIMDEYDCTFGHTYTSMKTDYSSTLSSLVTDFELLPRWNSCDPSCVDQ